MKYLFIILLTSLTFAQESQDQDFINFVLLNNQEQKSYLKQFDSQAKSTSLNEFKLLYMAELAKEIFGELDIPKKVINLQRIIQRRI